MKRISWQFPNLIYLFVYDHLLSNLSLFLLFDVHRTELQQSGLVYSLATVSLTQPLRLTLTNKICYFVSINHTTWPGLHFRPYCGGCRP